MSTATAKRIRTAALISFLTLSDYKETEDHVPELNQVKLKIIEQPQEHCRYRYKSEMSKQGGSHGPIYGIKSKPMKKSYPSVRLLNYDKEARIRAKTVQTDTYFDHPHTLTEHDLGMDVYEMVSLEKNGYVAIFNNLKLINTEKNRSYNVVLEKCKIQLERANQTYSLEELERICKEYTLGRNKPSLNNLRLMFSAHDPVTDELLCKPVISDVINNDKSPESNRLNIVKSSIIKGKAVGDDEIILLVEKIQKDNIKVSFVQVNDTKEVVWQEYASFLQSDVHKQYAIVCRTPPYKERVIDKDVKVYIELVRPSDGKTSERLSFTYIANRIRDRTYSSFGSSLGSSLSSRDIPQPAMMMAQGVAATNNTEMNSPYSEQEQIIIETRNLLADAFQAKYAQDNDFEMLDDSPMMDVNSTASLPAGLNSIPSLPHLTIGSSDLPSVDLPIPDLNMDDDEKTQFKNVNWNEYSESNPEVFIQFVQQELISDSGRVKIKKPDESTEVDPKETTNTAMISETINIALPGDSSNDGVSTNEKELVTVLSNEQDLVTVQSNEQNLVTVQSNEQDLVTVPTDEEYLETVEEVVIEHSDLEDTVVKQVVMEDSEVEDILVKQLIPQFCILLKNNVKNAKETQIREKLHEIFQMRFADGGTFLQWGMNTRKMVNVEVLVTYLSEYHLYEYLNAQDNQGETVMHHAVKRNLHHKIEWLISSGCSPIIADDLGNTPLHIAVLRKRTNCVKELVNAIKKYKVQFDFFAKNADGHTPLYLACVHQYVDSVRALASITTSLEQPENVKPEETSGRMGIRTPLHLAALTHDYNVFSMLMETGLKYNVDGLDDRGYTALQILCGGEMKEQTLKIATLLLENGADPALKIGTRQSALELCHDKQELCDLLYKYIDGVEVKVEEDVKSEVTDYDTAEEDVITLEEMKLEVFENQLEGSSAFQKPLSAMLDGSGKWKQLATKLGMESLINMLAEAPSPTAQLLDQVQIVDPLVTSPAIAKILFEMDEREAGQLILDYVDV